MKNELILATWVSRLIRWALAAVFAFIAWKFEDGKILYLFAAVAFVSGFFVPRRCVEENCNISERNHS